MRHLDVVRQHTRRLADYFKVSNDGINGLVIRKKSDPIKSINVAQDPCHGRRHVFEEQVGVAFRHR